MRSALQRTVATRLAKWPGFRLHSHTSLRSAHCSATHELLDLKQATNSLGPSFLDTIPEITLHNPQALFQMRWQNLHKPMGYYISSSVYYLLITNNHSHSLRGSIKTNRCRIPFLTSYIIPKFILSPVTIPQIIYPSGTHSDMYIPLWRGFTSCLAGKTSSAKWFWGNFS